MPITVSRRRSMPQLREASCPPAAPPGARPLLGAGWSAAERRRLLGTFSLSAGTTVFAAGLVFDADLRPLACQAPGRLIAHLCARPTPLALCAAALFYGAGVGLLYGLLCAPNDRPYAAAGAVGVAPILAASIMLWTRLLPQPV